MGCTNPTIQNKFQKHGYKIEEIEALFENIEFIEVDEEFLQPRDWAWEMEIYRKVFSRNTEILANFRICDTGNTGSLVLEEFHYVLVKSCPWLSKQEINLLVQFAIREAGAIDAALTAKTKLDLQAHARSRMVSYALYPDGTRHRVSYLFFILCLEKITKEVS